MENVCIEVLENLAGFADACYDAGLFGGYHSVCGHVAYNSWINIFSDVFFYKVFKFD
jgi:hypothetical protein